MGAAATAAASSGELVVHAPVRDRLVQHRQRDPRRRGAAQKSSSANPIHALSLT
jgi:hypothetical protein